MENAFHAMAAQSAAYTSSSKKPCYDVFINHRGKDVKHKLASTIYKTLDLMGVRAFLDEDELEFAESFPEAIEEAMRTASVHIAILSPGYADSPWCLEELSFMLQIQVAIIPVFYGVKPTDLRYATKGIYADAFRRHQKKRRYSPEMIRKWIEALSRVSYVTGAIVDADKCDEGKLLRKIVESALLKMKKVPLEVAMFPVGLDEAVQDFESGVGSYTASANVQIVGIVGMGGSGKTTLARELYNRKCYLVDRSSFLSNVRDASSTNTLHNLQKQLLENLRIQHSAFHNIHEGMTMLPRDLRSMTVLIVLDDVDDLEQMHALLPPQHNLGRGSFIIVTTREVDVLKSAGISSIYPMKLLHPFKAKQLFWRHAFLHPYSQLGLEHPVENFHNFEDLIERFVEACNGLPLSLKVLGAMVNGKSKAFWECQLLKISSILPIKLAESLKVSYDALDPQVQQMFLDIACFFIGGKKSQVVAIWDGSGWSGDVGWETLVNKCLVGLDKSDCIEMHDHLRDLGRQIAKDVSPSRIWKEEQISIQGGRTPIRGIVVDSLEHCMEKIIERRSLPALQLLATRGNDFKEEFGALSRDLVWLRWCDFNGTNLPSWLSLANLRVLDLPKVKNIEELWQDNVQLRELIVDLAGRTCFRGLPRSIGQLRHLKKIVLNGSGNRVTSFPDEFCHLRSLEILILSHFPMLSSMPHHFGELRNLRVLDLFDVALRELPDSFKQLRLRQFLSISVCRNFTFTSKRLYVLDFMTELESIRISCCPQLQELPHLTTQVSLRELHLRSTSLRELPNNIGQLTKLESLTIGSHKLTSLPRSLGELSSLTSLQIYTCKKLIYLPEEFKHLPNLQSLEFDRTPITDRGLWMESPTRCSSSPPKILRELLNKPIWMKSGWSLKNLKCLCLSYTKVLTISISDHCCPSLRTLRLLYNLDLKLIETLPGSVTDIIVHRCKQMTNITGIGGLLDLERLEVLYCRNLEVLPCPEYLRFIGGKITMRGCPKAERQIKDLAIDYRPVGICCGPVAEEVALDDAFDVYDVGNERKWFHHNSDPSYYSESENNIREWELVPHWASDSWDFDS